MIAEYNQAVLTTKGREAVSRQLAYESTITFTRFGVGNGEYTEEEKSIRALEALTGLKNEKNTYPISGKKIEDDGVTVDLKFTITNCDTEGHAIVTESYYANEIGLFAKVDGGDEFLFSIAVCTGSVGDAIIAYTGSNPVQIVQTYAAVVSNTEHVTINMQGAYAYTEDLEALAEVVARKGDSLTYDDDKDGVWLNSGSDKLSFLRLGIKAILAAIDALGARVTQVEEQLRRMMTFSYDALTETLNMSSDDITYDSEEETIFLPQELATYDEATETITLIGSGGGGGGGLYTLPVATASTLGGVMIGENINVEEDGTITVDTSDTTEAAEETISDVSNDLSEDDIDSLWD